MLEQIGWVRYDGDEYSDFRYWRVSDRLAEGQLEAHGWLRVYVKVEDPAHAAGAAGRVVRPTSTEGRAGWQGGR